MSKQSKGSGLANMLLGVIGLQYESKSDADSDLSDAEYIAKLAAEAKKKQAAMAQSTAPQAEVTAAAPKAKKAAPEPSPTDAEALRQRTLAVSAIMDYVMIEKNREGLDFAEFLDILEKSRSIAPTSSEEQLYKLAAIQFSNVEPSYLLTTGTAYVQDLEAEFFQRLKKEMTEEAQELVRGPENEAKRLQKENTELEKKIEQLQNQIKQNEEKMGATKANAAQARISLNLKQAAFQEVIPATIKQFQDIMSKIKIYIGGTNEEVPKT